MTRRKIFLYNLALYAGLLGLEIFTVVSSRLNSFTDSKVLYSLANYSLSTISLDIIKYCLIVLAIYLACAFGNYRIIIYLTEKLRSPRAGEGKTLLLIFGTHNTLFILAILIFNQVFYPLSEHSSWGILSVSGSCLVLSLFFIFCFIYTMILVASAGKYRIWAGVAIFVTLATVLSYNYLPRLRAEYLYRTNVPSPENTPVILLGIDSLRPDLLTPFGAVDSTLPNIEQFLGQSILFKNAHTPLARTFPSWLSVLSGNYPINSGARYNLIKRKRLQPHTPLLGKTLKKHGYKNIFAIDETRFCNMLPEDGFDTMISPPPGMVDFILGNFHDFTLINLFFNNRFGHLLFPFAKHNRAIPHLYTADIFVDDILQNLDELSQETRKIFMALHLCAAHWPYKISGSSSAIELEHESRAAKHQTIAIPTDYRDALRIADNQLGRIMAGLKRRNLYNQALIIVFSDHGETFGENGSWGHGTSLFAEAQNHVVMAIKPPFATSAQVKRELVSAVDIAPTILDVLAIPHSPDLYDGLPLLSEKSPYPDQVREIFLETGFHLFHKTGKGFTLEEMIQNGYEFYEASPQSGYITVRDLYHEQILAQKQLSVRSENWQLIVQKMSGGQWDQFLLDRTAANGSQRNLLSVYPEKALELKAAAEKHFQIQLTPEN